MGKDLHEKTFKLKGFMMKKNQTLKDILEELDSTIANAIDKLDEAVTYGEDLTEEEFDVIQDHIDSLEAIRGVINE